MKSLVTAFLLLGATASAQLLAPPPPEPAPEKPKAPDFGKWQVTQGRSHKDGSPTLAATLASDAPLHTDARDSIPTLVCRFKDKEIDAYIAFGNFVGSDSVKLLIIRGDQDPEEESWVVSEDGTIAFGPDDAISFMHSLAAVDKVTFRINRPNRDPIVVTFTPKGITAVIDAILKTAAK